MILRQKIVALIVGISIFVTIILLVREKKLKEEYSWLWIMVGVVILMLPLKYEWLIILTSLIGAVLPTSTILFFGFIFMILICLQFSIRISKLTVEHKNLIQKIAIMDQELEEFRDQTGEKTFSR